MENKEEKKYIYNKLTPVKDADIRGYEEILEFTLSEDDINNIAITGTYGSGKSSVMETFKKKKGLENNFLNISLSAFDPINSKKSEQDEKDSAHIDGGKVSQANINQKENEKLNIEAIIEGKIINQLLHKINDENIPNTIFKNKRAKNSNKIFWTGIIITLLFLSSMTILYFNEVRWFLSILESSFNSQISRNIGKLAVAAVFVLCIIIIIRELSIMIYNNNLIRKMKIRGNELEILSSNDESFFDKYLNEVLYLFSNSGYKGIVFEDLDRFDINMLFTKLREVNDLINFGYIEESHNYVFSKINPINIIDDLYFLEKIRKIFREVKTRIKKGMNKLVNVYSKTKDEKIKQKIKFYYLIRDDVFTSDDRTKFFDIIIPIVPGLSRNNMRDKLVSKLCTVHGIENNYESTNKINPLIYDVFPQKFIRDISYYISDKRLLNNIMNEYNIYKNKIGVENIEYTRLLSIVIYKNYFQKILMTCSEEKAMFTDYLKCIIMGIMKILR